MSDTRSVDGATTRQRLLDGAMAVIRESGISGVSARAIATAAGVNQALVFYHFGSVDKLLAEACRAATADSVASYRERFEAVHSLRDLLHTGQELHAEAQRRGDITVLAQTLAGSQSSAELAAATRDCLGLWIAEIEIAVHRILRDSPLAGLIDPAGLTRSFAAGFIGLALIEKPDPDWTAQALSTLDQLGAVAEVLDELGPISRRAVRAKLRNRKSRS